MEASCLRLHSEEAGKSALDSRSMARMSHYPWLLPSITVHYCLAIVGFRGEA
jgi:hypothetical protein